MPKDYYDITWGTLRGEDIHVACATPEESTLTWGRFAGPAQAAPDKDCPRCGVSLAEVPDP